MLITFHLFPGESFQTFNVHQVLHLKEAVVNLGQLWSNPCFPYEDFNRDLRGYFQEVNLFKKKSANFVFFPVEIFKLHVHVFYNLIFKFNFEL